MEKKRNILILDNSIGFTGAFKSILFFARELKDQFNFHLALDQRANLDSHLADCKFPVIKVPFLELSKSFKSVFYLPVLLANTYKIIQYCNKNKIDVLHVNDLYNMVGVVVKIFKPKIRLIYHVRLLPTSYAGKLYSRWLRFIDGRADTVVVVSATVADAVKPYVLKAPLVIVYDYLFLSDNAFVNEDSSAFVLLYPANYTMGKGHDLALKAFSYVCKLNDQIMLRFVGSDFGTRKNAAYKSRLMQDAKLLGIHQKVVFETETVNMEAEMKSAHVILNFSESESFSLTCYEALYYGRPLIATDSGGPGELIENGCSGILITKGNMEAMVAAIQSLMDDRHYRQSLAVQGATSIRKKIKEHRALERLARTYIGQ